jgi:hypothetical protein
MHQVKRFVLAQSPVHPQYLDAGISFDANLLQPLDFGTELVKPESLMDIGNTTAHRKRCARPAGDAIEFSHGEEGRTSGGRDYGTTGGC